MKKILLLGAGFSKNSSEKFPDWLQLINQLKQGLPEMKGRTLNFLQLAQEYQNKFGSYKPTSFPGT